MRAQPIPLAGPAYGDETRPWSQQDTCNYLPCSAEVEGTRSPTMLKTPPGLYPFVEKLTPLPDDVEGYEYTPVRGTHNAEGKLFAVIGPTLYRISDTGVAIPIGSVPGQGRVDMDHNQISLGNELVVVNGSAGYLYNTVTDQFGRITDTGYPGSSVAKFSNGYMLGIEPQGRYAFSSLPAQAGEYNTLDRFTSEYKPDRLVGIGTTGNNVLILATNSGEFFQATANAQQPFRSMRSTLDKGCAGWATVAEADNSIFWLGSDGYFYMLEGYSARRISTRPIEQAIRGLDWSNAFAFVWEDAGHTVVYWTFPDGRTWGFDTAERQWHRRESYGLNRWRVSSMTRWQDGWIAGDFQHGRLWRMDWDYPLEGDVEFVSKRTIAVIHDNQSLMLIPRLELVMDTGMALVTPASFSEQPEPPTITGDAPGGALGDDYTFSYTLDDGTPPYTVTLRSGALPTGLSLSAAGVLSGELDAMGDFDWVVRVTDSNGLWDDLDDSATVTLTPSRMVTNSHFYTGTRTNLVLGDSIGWTTGQINSVAASPDGEYIAGAFATSGAAGRFQIRKYDAATEAYIAVADPATYPDVGPSSMTWHPSGDYLLCARTDNDGGDNDNWILYVRDGDTFTPADYPAELMASNSLASAWDFTGDRFAISNSSTGNVVGVYAFDTEAGTIGALIDGCNLGTGEQAARFSFRPEADSPYLLVRGADYIYVLDVSADPITVAASYDVNATSVATYWTADGNYIIDVQNTGSPNYINVYAFDDTPGSEAITTAATTIEQPAWQPGGAAITSTRDFLALERSTVGSNYPPYVWTISAATPPVLAKQADTSDMGAVLDAVAWTRTAG